MSGYVTVKEYYRARPGEGTKKRKTKKKRRRRGQVSFIGPT